MGFFGLMGYEIRLDIHRKTRPGRDGGLDIGAGGSSCSLDIIGLHSDHMCSSHSVLSSRFTILTLSGYSRPNLCTSSS